MVAIAARGAVTVPRDAVTLPGFRKWYAALGEDAPRIHYLRGDLHIEMSPQNYRSHLPVATQINAVLALLCQELDLGEYYGDGGWLTNEQAELSNGPDGFLVRWETFQAGVARLAEGREGELEGRADMVLEVVSKTSVVKDTVELRGLYAAAGVPEYWIADARDEPPSLRILRLEGPAYHEQPIHPAGWVHSGVWGQWFRLTSAPNRLGQRSYRLERRAVPPER